MTKNFTVITTPPVAMPKKVKSEANCGAPSEKSGLLAGFLALFGEVGDSSQVY